MGDPGPLLGSRSASCRFLSVVRDTLPGMVSPNVARLARRVDEQDETVRALSDTMLDIKETVDQHTETLTAVQGTLAQHTETLATVQGTLVQHGESLATVQGTLAQHGELLTQHGELLVEILRRLGNIAPE